MSNETVVKRTVKRTTVTSSGGSGGIGGVGVVDLGTDGGYQKLHHYQVYRGLSPSSANRIELKIRELEEAADQERALRLKAEKDLAEVSFQLESLSERLEESDGIAAAQSELVRRREYELQKLKKEFELLSIQHETSEAALRKRHQEMITELTEQLELLNRNKAKGDKDKQTLVIEIETVSGLFEAANKAKLVAESKLNGQDDLIRKLKAQVDDLSRQNHDLAGSKARLTQENHNLHHQVQDLDRSNADLAKAKNLLQQQVDDLKNRLDEETRLREQLAAQLANLQVDFESLQLKYDEDIDAQGNLRNQLQKALTDYQALKNRYDAEIGAVSEELEDTRRKLLARVTEVEELLEQSKLRIIKLEKEKSKFQIEIRDISVELESAHSNVLDLGKKLKGADGLGGELQKRVEELTVELNSVSGDNQRLIGELSRLKAILKDIEDKNDGLARENKQLSDALRDALGQNKDLMHKLQETQARRQQLESEKDSLVLELTEANDNLKDALSRLDGANAALNQLRSELERRLREKDDEIENIRKASQRAIEELQKAIVEIEAKYKAEIARLKKKNEGDLREFEIQLEALNRANADLSKANKAAIARIKELELALDEERRRGEDARQAAALLDRKRLVLQAELDDLKSLLDVAERGRKAAEIELSEVTTRVSELTVSLTSSATDKRRFEGDLATLHAELEEALSVRRAAEDRADRLQQELARLGDELRQEQDNYRNSDAQRRQLEVEIRQLAVKLEQAEAFGQREAKRIVDKLQSRLRELETELEAEQRRSRDLAAEVRKLQRLLQEQKTQSDEDRRIAIELNEQVNILNNKIRILKKQLEEAEEVVAITMNKYRKAMQLLEEAERHQQADVEKSTVIHGGHKGSRSMSVTREVTRVVRV